MSAVNYSSKTDRKHPEDLKQILATPESLKLIAKIIRNNVLSAIYGEQHTTQDFETADNHKKAFHGEIVTIDSEVTSNKLEEVIRQYKKYIVENNITYSLQADLYFKLQLERNNISEEDLTKLLEKVWIYSRLTNPTNELLEEVLSEIEKSESTAVFASGLAALHATIDQFSKSAWENQKEGKELKGDKIVVIGAIYGGTFAAIQNSCNKTGREFQHLPISDFLEKGLPEDTAMVIFESCNNPNLNVTPIQKIKESVDEIKNRTGQDIKIVCDNTFTPWTVKPLELGADLVIHSMTKYLNGKSEDLGGSVSGKEELISQFRSLKDGERMVNGGIMAPRVAKEFLKNIETLIERLYYCSKNAEMLKKVGDILGLKSRTVKSNQAWEEIRDKNISDSISNGMLTIDFGTPEKAHEFVDTLAKEGVGKLAVSLGSETTYYSIPAETTHSELSPEEQKRAGITPGLVRISCGTEEDLVPSMLKILKRLATQMNHNDESLAL